MSKMKYLSYNQVIDVYREQVGKYGGYCAIRDNGALLAVIANPQRQFAGRDLYQTLADKAAILVFSMLKNHPFVDGNKRTAFICGRVLLRMNGKDASSLEEYYKLIVRIAEGSAEQADVVDWFKMSIRNLSDKTVKNNARKE
ncbi:MAG: type II toxin-antitoxin system death-on-curing family toxin [Candidatus Omnitrophota bacterium]